MIKRFKEFFNKNKFPNLFKEVKYADWKKVDKFAKFSQYEIDVLKKKFKSGLRIGESKISIDFKYKRYRGTNYYKYIGNIFKSGDDYYYIAILYTPFDIGDPYRSSFVCDTFEGLLECIDKHLK